MATRSSFVTPGFRSPSFEPWGNVALVSGVDAPVWFQKAGTIVPDYYANRANYTER